MEKVQTSAKLQFFSGFYESIWSAGYELENYEYEEGVTDDDYDFDYDGYQDEVGERVTEVYQEWVRECIGCHVRVTYGGITSPKYYNYSTDSIDVVIEFDEVGKREILRAFRKHYFAIAAMIARECRSYSGYISFLTDEYWDWTDERLFDGAAEFDQPAYLSSLLDYIIRADFRARYGHSESLDYLAYEEAGVSVWPYITRKNESATTKLKTA